MRSSGGSVTIVEELDAAAQEAPSKVWLRFLNGDSYTFAEAAGAIKRVALGLLDLGLVPGDRLVTFVGNRAELLLTWFAAHAAGLIVVPLNPSLRGDILGTMLAGAGAKAVVVDREVLPPLDEALRVASSQPVRISVDGGAGTVPFWSLLNESAVSLHRTPPKLSDPCCMMYTSGTTGPSKGAQYCHGFHLHMGAVGADNMAYAKDDVLFTCLPLFHGNALNTSVVPSLLARAELVMSPRFSASRFWAEVGQVGATAVNLLGAMTPILLRQPVNEAERGHRARRGLVIPAPPEYHTLLPRRFGLRPIEAYGLTDGGMVLWCPLDREAPPGSCGLPTEGYDCRLVDDQDNEVPTGTIGELVFRPTLPWITPLGYWRMPAATVSAWRNLWFHTGDLLRRDDAGWFYFAERAKDVIRRRGENVSAFELESAALQHEAVLECAAYAVPSDLLEDEVAIAVVKTPGSLLTERELLEFLTPRLPYFAVPRYIRFVEALRLTDTLKVRKQALREEGVVHAWDRVAAGVVVDRSS